MTDIAIINPLTPSADEKAVLGRFLEAQIKKYPDGFLTSTTTDIKDPQDKENNKTYRLSQPMIYLKALGKCIIFGAEPSGKGISGVVYFSEATLQVDKEGNFIYGKESFVFKKGLRGYKSLYKEEVANGQDIPYLKSTKVPNLQGAVGIIMKKVPGDELYKKNEKIKALSIDQKIYLSLQLCRQLQEQLHHRGPHLDIKPENIVVQEKGEKWFPRYIDLGLSKAKDEVLDAAAGSGLYMAPEVAHEKVKTCDSFMDLYSLGILLVQLWEGDFNLTGISEESCCIEKTQFCEKCYQERKFYFSKETPAEVVNLLKELTQYNFEKRANLDQAIKVFDEMRFNRKLKNIHAASYQAIKDANVIANNARKSLRKINCNVDQMKAIVTRALQKIENNPDALSEFSEVTNIKLFQGIKDKKICQQLFYAVCDAFDKKENKGDFLNHLKSAVKIDNIVKYMQSNDENFIKKIKEDIQAKNERIKTLQIQKLDVFIKDLRDYSMGESQSFDLNQLEKIKFDEELSRQPISLEIMMLIEMQKYIIKTLDEKSLKKHDRAASIRRVNDMSYMIKLMESNYTDEEKKALIKNHFKRSNFTTGFFGRSELRSGLLNAVKQYEIATHTVKPKNSILFGSFYKKPKESTPRKPFIPKGIF